MKIKLLIILVSLLASEAFGGEIHSDKGCQNNPEVIGQCFTVHGRISVYNGTPGVRIWQIGTDHLLGVLPSEDEIMPASVKTELGANTQIYGDYLVCPFTREQKGCMHMVCIESASNLRVENLLPRKRSR
jgi:hypothetical protein